MRIRYLKPEFFHDEDVANLPYDTRLVFMGLWCWADREGRLEDRPLYLKGMLFPYSEVCPLNRVDIERCLRELSTYRKRSGLPFILRYEDEHKRKFIQILNFQRHQKIHPGEKNSTIPAPDVQKTLNLIKFNEIKLNSIKLPLGIGIGIGIGIGTGMGRGRGRGNNLNHSDKIPYSEILSDLNTLLKSNYKNTTPKTRKLIQIRWTEGFRLDDFKTVHRNMVRAWGNNSEMRPFLRPITLYSTKFESYLNQHPPKETKINAPIATEPEWMKEAKKVMRQEQNEKLNKKIEKQKEGGDNL